MRTAVQGKWYNFFYSDFVVVVMIITTPVVVCVKNATLCSAVELKL
jgi:hypothetical protein